MSTPPRSDAERRVAEQLAKRFAPGPDRLPVTGRPPRGTAGQAAEQLARRFPGTVTATGQPPPPPPAPTPSPPPKPAGTCSP